MDGRIYEVDHLTLLSTKYLSSGPHGFREDFFIFFHYNLCEILFLIKQQFLNCSGTLKTVPKLFICSVPEHVRELMKNILRILNCLEMFLKSA